MNNQTDKEAKKTDSWDVEYASLRKIALTGSWGMIEIAFLRSLRPIVEISTPSKVMEPDVSSTKR